MRRIYTATSVLVLCAVLILGAIVGCGEGGPDAAATTGLTSASSTSTTTSTGGGNVPTTAPAAGEKTFTLADLAQFDGTDGRPAYIAVDGVVYDVSGSARWPEGRHTSCNLAAMAGKDLSTEIDQAPPSMRKLLERLAVVGALVP